MIEAGTHFGAWSLIPPLVVVVIAILTKRSVEPLIIGCVVGYLMLGFTDFPGNFIGSLIKTMQDESLVWVIMVCCLYGAIIHLLIQSGGAFAFGRYMPKHIKNEKTALLSTWLMGIIIFIDDYLNALVVGSSMRKITDRFRVSREKLAYIVNSTSAPVCVLIPVSTWSIYIGKLIEDEGVVAKGKGFMGFVQTIPFNFYSWFAIFMVLGLILGWIPNLGKMKTAEKRAKETGMVIPPGSESLQQSSVIEADTDKAKPAYFFIPLAVLIIGTIAFGIDALKGVGFAVIFTIAYYWYKKILPYHKLFDGVIEGFKSMIFPLVILVMSYVLKNVGDEMGMTQYVIESVQGTVPREYLAAVIFLTLGVIAFATGSSWGIYAIAIPLVVPLATALGANLWLVLGAVISAGTLGAHACFYSDATILTATGTECNTIQHALSQLPYALISTVLALILFTVFGMIL
jgi:tetracycline resistance efflux pump